MLDVNRERAEKRRVGKPKGTEKKGKPAKPMRVGPLNTQKTTRLFVSKVIRKVARGELDSLEGYRMVQMARVNSGIIEADVLEARLDRVEKRQEEIDRRRDNQL